MAGPSSSWCNATGRRLFDRVRLELTESHRVRQRACDLVPHEHRRVPFFALTTSLSHALLDRWRAATIKPRTISTLASMTMLKRRAAQVQHEHRARGARPSISHGCMCARRLRGLVQRQSGGPASDIGLVTDRRQLVTEPETCDRIQPDPPASTGLSVT
jgi:hypothetical protein